MIFTTLLLSTLIIVLVIGIFFSSKLTGKFFNITSKVHYTIAFSFIALLFIMTIIVEVLFPSSEVRQLPLNENAFDDVVIGSSAEKIDSIDESEPVTKRTHEIENQLTIYHDDADYSGADIWIERKDVNDGIVEEYITKPLYMVNNHDLSNEVDIALPEWQGNAVTFSKQPTFEFNFAYYTGSFILNQFTGEKSYDLFSGFSSSGRTMSIHLIVPKDLKIDGDLEYVSFDED